MQTPLRLSYLSSGQLEKLLEYRYDWFVEKHEGPWSWKQHLEFGTPDFMRIGPHDVLLPIEREQHPNVTVKRWIPSNDENVLTVFLEDTTYFEGMFAGFLAICERVPGESWFVATVYHEWYAPPDNQPLT